MAKVLLGVETRFEKELGTLKRVSGALSKNMDIISVSSVYELNEPYPYGLSAVFLLETKNNYPAEIFIELRVLMDSVKTGVSDWAILAIEDQIYRSSEATVPHPLFHKTSKWMVPAVDVQESFVHPILNQSLRATLNSLDSVSGITFFKQNKTLLDFLPNEK